MLNDWKQYSTFPFIGPDDIDRLYNVLLAAGLRPQLEDVGNRPQYWLLQLVTEVGNGTSPSSEIGITWTPDNSSAVNVGSIDIAGIITFHSLINVTGSFNAGAGVSNVVGIRAPLLASVAGNFNVFSSSSIQEIQVPSLVSIGGDLDVDSNSSLAQVELLSLVSVNGNLFFNDCTILTTIMFPLFSPTNGTINNFSNCALNVASVDGILATFVSNPAFVSGTINLGGGTNSPPSSVAPGSDYDILVNRGVTVNVN